MFGRAWWSQGPNKGVDPDDVLGMAPKKRQRATMEGDTTDLVIQCAPRPLAGDHASVVAALATVPMASLVAFEDWVRALPNAAKTEITDALEAAQRTGNQSYLASIFVQHTDQMKNLEE